MRALRLTQVLGISKGVCSLEHLTAILLTLFAKGGREMESACGDPLINSDRPISRGPRKCDTGWICKEKIAVYFRSQVTERLSKNVVTVMSIEIFRWMQWSYHLWGVIRNRNKWCIWFVLKTRTNCYILETLCKWADKVINNFWPTFPRKNSAVHTHMRVSLLF